MSAQNISRFIADVTEMKVNSFKKKEEKTQETHLWLHTHTHLI